ncbi:MAG: hypothetical protein HFG45_00025 [Oscillospiraceae bacterium]|nr:hypothetical protein [Oscillospiraceae bacterium]
MTLQELSKEYRQSGEMVRRRVRTLETCLSVPGMTETQRIELQRRLCLLRVMARDTIAMSRYLAQYYNEEVQ